MKKGYYFTTADVQFSTQNQVKSKKGYHVRRYPVISAQNQGKSKKRSLTPAVVLLSS